MESPFLESVSKVFREIGRLRNRSIQLREANPKETTFDSSYRKVREIEDSTCLDSIVLFLQKVMYIYAIRYLSCFNPMISRPGRRKVLALTF